MMKISPGLSRYSVIGSLRLVPPRRKIPGAPIEIEMMGAVRSFSVLSWCLPRLSPKRYLLIRQASGLKLAGMYSLLFKKLMISLIERVSLAQGVPR